MPRLPRHYDEVLEEEEEEKEEEEKSRWSCDLKVGGLLKPDLCGSGLSPE